MAHFAFEQQLSEAVSSLGYIFFPVIFKICYSPPYLTICPVGAGAHGFLHQCELHHPTPVSETKPLQAKYIRSWPQQVNLNFSHSWSKDLPRSRSACRVGEALVPPASSRTNCKSKSPARRSKTPTRGSVGGMSRWWLKCGHLGWAPWVNFSNQDWFRNNWTLSSDT